MNITTIIPTFKNRDMLLRNLSHNLPFLKQTKIIIVNDDPNDNTLGFYLHTHFPDILSIQHTKNKGFAGSINDAMTYVETPYVFLLNNDVVLHDATWQKTTTLFEKDSSLFSVSFAQVEKNKKIVGANTGSWEKGLFHHRAAPTNTSHPTLWPEGGSSLVSVTLFRKLSGYDNRFNPFYWEDVDLGYRAWKAGYRVLFNRNIVVEHHHETTIGSAYSKEYIATIASRNQLYFVWKNADNKNLRTHFSQLPRLVASQWKTNKPFVNGFFKALPHLPGILMSRGKQKKLWQKTDDEVIKSI